MIVFAFAYINHMNIFVADSVMKSIFFSLYFLEYPK